MSNIDYLDNLCTQIYYSYTNTKFIYKNLEILAQESYSKEIRILKSGLYFLSLSCFLNPDGKTGKIYVNNNVICLTPSTATTNIGQPSAASCVLPLTENDVVKFEIEDFAKDMSAVCVKVN